jgi:hypothetical protein
VEGFRGKMEDRLYTGTSPTRALAEWKKFDWQVLHSKEIKHLTGAYLLIMQLYDNLMRCSYSESVASMRFHPDGIRKGIEVQETVYKHLDQELSIQPFRGSTIEPPVVLSLNQTEKELEKAYTGIKIGNWPGDSFMRDRETRVTRKSCDMCYLVRLLQWIRSKLLMHIPAFYFRC